MIRRLFQKHQKLKTNYLPKANLFGTMRLFREYKSSGNFDYDEKIRFTKNPLTTVIIGKPNVGKSSIYNFLIHEGKSIVHPTPGITRDWSLTEVKDYRFPYRVIDTGGIHYSTETARKNTKGNPMMSKAKRKSLIDQTRSFFAPLLLKKCEDAMRRAHLVFFVVDPKSGITEEDIEIARYLKEAVIDMSRLEQEELDEIRDFPALYMNDSPDERIIVDKICLLANKCEHEKTYGAVNDLYGLGFGDPIFISAEEGDGMHQLWQEMEDLVSEEAIDFFEQRKKKRRQRYKELRADLKQEVIEEIENRQKANPDKDNSQLEIDVNQWLAEFDMMNSNPEENSDFDTDSEINPHQYLNKDIVMEKTGLSPHSYLFNRQINLSVIGRPNSGKSTLLNAFLEESRMMVSDQPHTTTDTTDFNWVYEGVKLKLIDTAGMERKSHQASVIDSLILKKTMKAIKSSQVVVVVIDSLEAFRNIDFDLITLCIDEGKPVVLVVNKWDLVTDKWKQRAAKFMVNQVEKSLGILNGVPVHFVSAKKGIRTKKILDDVLRVYTCWNTRISTGLLNNWVKKFKKVQKLPTKRAEKLRIFFVSQIKTRPPTFVFFINNAKMIDENYTKFVKKSFTQEFGMQGVPLRITFRGVQYKDLKRRVEKVFEGRQDDLILRRIFLKRRRMRTYGKIKLDDISSSRRSSRHHKY